MIFLGAGKHSEDECKKLVAQGLSLTRIKKEMTKCEIRCANCHMKRTFDDLGWKK